MRFEEAFYGWTERRLTQEESAHLLGVGPGPSVGPLTGTRKRAWRGCGRNACPRCRPAAPPRRERAAWPGMRLPQDGSQHEWGAGQPWDLIVTMDDTTNAHYSMFFGEEEGTQSCFQGGREVLEAHGLFCSRSADRGRHYWQTPGAGGKVDKNNLTPFGRAMNQLGIELIPAYSPEARGRSERAFRTHQDRLPKELAAAGLTTMAAANRYLQAVSWPAFNAEVPQPPREEGSAFVACPDRAALDDILCEPDARVVGKDNCVQFAGLVLQILADRHRYHSMQANVKVGRHTDGTLSLHHGPRRLASYDAQGQAMTDACSTAASGPPRGRRETSLFGRHRSGSVRCTGKSGPFICYRTGQIYLLTTGGVWVHHLWHSG